MVGELVYYNYIEGSIPLFLILIAVEFIVLSFHRRRFTSTNEEDWIPESGYVFDARRVLYPDLSYYEAADSWSSVAAGAMDVLLSIMIYERFPFRVYV